MAETMNPELEAPSMALPETKREEFGEIDAPRMSPEEIVAKTIPVLQEMPTQVPPSETAVGAEAEGITVWHNGKKIVALWSNVAARNAYISVPGLGWKKLSNANDSSFVSMTMMASHAEQMNSTVNLRIEADGTVHEIYVW